MAKRKQYTALESKHVTINEHRFQFLKEPNKLPTFCRAAIGALQNI
jgi:hypothetical protein